MSVRRRSGSVPNPRCGESSSLPSLRPQQRSRGRSQQRRPSEPKKQGCVRLPALPGQQVRSGRDTPPVPAKVPQDSGAGAKPDFLQACRFGDTRIVELLLRDASERMPPAAYSDMASRSRGITSAVTGGAFDTVQILLKSGFNPNRRDDNGSPAIVLAVKLDKQGAQAFHRDSRVLSLLDSLVSAGAEVQLRDRDGRTALWWAAKLGNLEAVQRLLALGADAATKDKVGQDALDVAASEDVKTVLEANIGLAD